MNSIKIKDILRIYKKHLTIKKYIQVSEILKEIDDIYVIQIQKRINELIDFNKFNITKVINFRSATNHCSFVLIQLFLFGQSFFVYE